MKHLAGAFIRNANASDYTQIDSACDPLNHVGRHVLRDLCVALKLGQAYRRRPRIIRDPYRYVPRLDRY